MRRHILTTLLIALASSLATPAHAQLAIEGDTVYTMAGEPLSPGMVIIDADGKITYVGTPRTDLPDSTQVIHGAVVTPGLIDAHTTVGLSGQYNYAHDQDQLEHSAPLQPELRAIDAYNPQERLIEWVRSFGVTTIHTGHAPGELISGQTMIAKLTGNTAEEAVLVRQAAVAATLGPQAEKSGEKAPGTRAKEVSLLRAEMIKAREYAAKQQAVADDPEKDPPTRDLRLDALVKVLDGELPLMITAHRAQDIASALRVAQEFNIRIWLDGAAESYLLIDEIKKADVPVILHPTMMRAGRETENASFETAAKLHAAGILVALQGGYESYVPKARVVLFEAGWAAANGFTFEEALATVTRDAAKLLGIDNRVGTLEPGKDGDIAIYDGDPFEYTTHCTTVIINGAVVSNTPH